MDLNKFRASFLSYDNIRGSAKSFLKRHNPTDEIPVNIELIVEKDYEINIIPVELERLLGIDALTSVNQKEIRVDINTLRNNNNRYRFSLAHEMGHIVLHRNIFEEVDFKSIDDFKRIQDEIPSDEYGWLEWQANCFAGLILVPSVELEKQIGLNVEKLSDTGFTIRDDNYEMLSGYISSPIAKYFAVSEQVVKIRIDKDDLDFRDFV